ncbi:MAG: DUF447 family protein [Promethearchaeota archaeon]|nr:MAG: DUF447 family protein [Candidatus Lokiarchaeota archaeon]
MGICLTEFNPKLFGLVPNRLYEIIATTYRQILGNIKPNASCMGIRVLEDNRISLNPFPNTTTFKNLKEKSLMAVNFVDDVYIYALAALKGYYSGIQFTEFPLKYYDYIDLKNREHQMPIINNAWAYLVCEIDEEIKHLKKDALNEIMITEFKLRVIQSKELKKSFSLFNRAENLTIESVIIATRLKICLAMNNKELYSKLETQLNYNIENIERFSKNSRVKKAMNLVQKYVSSL